MQKMKKVLMVVIAVLMVAGYGQGGDQCVQATSVPQLDINYVDSADNAQYPQTNKFISISGITGCGTFTVTTPTIIKAYMTWDTAGFDKATIWFSRDLGGIDLIGDVKTLNSVTSYSQYLLDPGTYYINYSMEAAKKDSFVYATAGLCLLGQPIASTEDSYSSSLTYPNEMTAGVSEVGFLSVTAPNDYYKFTIKEKSMVTIQFGFTELNDVKVNNAECNLMNSDYALIKSKKYSKNGVADNTFTTVLEAGTYYISMSGAQTTTTLKFTTVSYGSVGGNGTQSIPFLTLNYVNYIDNTLYPQTNKFTLISGLRGTGKIGVKRPTIVKAYMSWDSNSFGSATIWFSRDAEGLDVVGEEQKLKSDKTYLQYLLDPGTYYVNYSMTSNKKDDSLIATAGLCVIAQEIETTEEYYASSWTKPNKMDEGVSEIGFLSMTAPIDYYKFKVKNRSMVTVQFDFNQLNNVSVTNGECKLMNEDNMLIMTKKYSSKGIEQNTFSVMLDAGTYYLVMSGAQTTTSIKYEAVSYKVSATTENVGQKVKVKLNIPFEVDEIFVRKGNVSVTKINDTGTWSARNKECEELEGKSYIADKNGVYTFRIADAYGNRIYYKVKISTVDQSKPVISGAANGKIYTQKVTLKFSDKVTGIKSVTINGKKLEEKQYKNGYLIQKKGDYKVSVTDFAGNNTTISFQVK